MPPTVKVESHDAPTKAWQKEAAKRVIDHFGNQLPNRSLLCFFDDQDWPDLKEARGEAIRGFYKPEGYPGFRQGAPEYIIDFVFSAPPVFDNLIYLLRSTCENEVGLTMTFAHELQHFIQHSNMLPHWAANSFIYDFFNSVSYAALGLKTFSFPHEREARVVAKRTAELLHGAEDVRQYIDTKIADPVDADDAADWEFVQEIDTSVPYDLAGETKLFFQQLKPYRPGLEEYLKIPEVKNNPDFKYVDLDALFDGAGA